MTIESISQNYRILQNTLCTWGPDHYQRYPWRSTSNLWHALVAEMMLQRTDADQVLESYTKFAARYPSPEDFTKHPDSNVFAHLGLHWRQQYLLALAEELHNKPPLREQKDFTDLPGVGPYISAAIRSLHLGHYDYIIDSNVVRLYGRFFGFETHAETRRARWFIDLARHVTPESPEICKTYNYALIDFTRSICKPSPSCHHCPLLDHCQSPRQS